MIIKEIKDVVFQDYYKPSMLIVTSKCDWKCGDCCQNKALADMPDIDMPDDQIVARYINNPISEAIVFGGLEPILQVWEMIRLIDKFRNHGVMDDVVVYSGYTMHEMADRLCLSDLAERRPIIIKYGRYIPNREKVFDENLGVYLSSDNQHSFRVY